LKSYCIPFVITWDDLCGSSPFTARLKLFLQLRATPRGAAASKESVKPGYDANLLIVDGNPLRDIRQTENLSQIILRGERIHRAGLFEQE
jgi:hypothetical protein